jgi:hypothetical protein
MGVSPLPARATQPCFCPLTSHSGIAASTLDVLGIEYRHRLITLRRRVQTMSPTCKNWKLVVSHLICAARLV